ncbi:MULTISPECIES: CAP domain-containing protein [Sphingomonas]|uniref:CAP domain-containing protein n=1 Tax=Sphingomonas TaxID=13687 RepID=UPI000DEED7E2|nr:MULTISPECIES: CAP domain-containing protein [Sphingomonas]
MIRAALSLLFLPAPCTASAATWVPVTPARPSANWPAAAPRGDALLRATALALHNRARADFGVAPVTWNEGLATATRTYAEQMAATGLYRHDPTPGRRKLMGENLWRGTRGAFDYQVMIGVMVDERALFRPGVFPNVSATGDWEAVAHWTQIVWPKTTEIGCAVASSATTDYLVCRYAPTGNKDGLAMGPDGPVQLASGR